MNEFIRSPMNYTCGKYKLLSSIIPMFPKQIDTFVDLFCGGMNVSINVNANKIYANDRINYLIEIYEYFMNNDTEHIISEIQSKIKPYGLSSDDKDSYIAFRDNYNKTKNTLDLFILSCYSFNHNIRFNNSHEFNDTFGLRSYNDSIEDNLRLFCNKLHSSSFTLSSNDFRQFDFSILKKNDLVYCDPPYSITTATYNDGNRGFGGWSSDDDNDLFNLLDRLNNNGILFALSNVTEHRGATNDNLIKWSKNYNLYNLDKSYSDCSYNVKNRHLKTIEVLITNYDCDKIVAKRKLF